MSLDTNPQMSQAELSGTYGDGSKHGVEHEGGEDGEADRNLAIDRLIEVLVDLDVK